MRSGFVSIVGRPNVGKSTLLNSIIGRKVAITSDKSQTTRNNIQGVYTDGDVQMVFVDTPGIHKPQNKLGKLLNKQAYYALDDVNVILLVVDITNTLGKGDLFVIETLKNYQIPVVLVINKIDCLPKEEILLKISEYKDLYPFEEIVPVSSLKRENIEVLLKVLEKYMTDDIQYYPEDIVTNNTLDFSISEFIREKILYLTEQEVPHSVTCILENIEESKSVISVDAAIIVDRENLKKIIVGHRGQMIKKIGILARKDIESYLGKKVYLNLFVKVVPNWRDKEKFLNEIGFKDIN